MNKQETRRINLEEGKLRPTGLDSLPKENLKDLPENKRRHIQNKRAKVRAKNKIARASRKRNRVG